MDINTSLMETDYETAIRNYRWNQKEALEPLLISLTDSKKVIDALNNLNEHEVDRCTAKLLSKLRSFDQALYRHHVYRLVDNIDWVFRYAILDGERELAIDLFGFANTMETSAFGCLLDQMDASSLLYEVLQTIIESLPTIITKHPKLAPAIMKLAVENGNLPMIKIVLTYLGTTQYEGYSTEEIIDPFLEAKNDDVKAFLRTFEVYDLIRLNIYALHKYWICLNDELMMTQMNTYFGTTLSLPIVGEPISVINQIVCDRSIPFTLVGQFCLMAEKSGLHSILGKSLFYDILVRIVKDQSFSLHDRSIALNEVYLWRRLGKTVGNDPFSKYQNLLYTVAKTPYEEAQKERSFNKLKKQYPDLVLLSSFHAQNIFRRPFPNIRLMDAYWEDPKIHKDRIYHLKPHNASYSLYCRDRHGHMMWYYFINSERIHYEVTRNHVLIALSDENGTTITFLNRHTGVEYTNIKIPNFRTRSLKVTTETAYLLGRNSSGYDQIYYIKGAGVAILLDLPYPLKNLYTEVINNYYIVTERDSPTFKVFHRNQKIWKFNGTIEISLGEISLGEINGLTIKNHRLYYRNKTELICYDLKRDSILSTTNTIKPYSEIIVSNDYIITKGSSLTCYTHNILLWTKDLKHNDQVITHDHKLYVCNTNYATTYRLFDGEHLCTQSFPNHHYQKRIVGFLGKVIVLQTMRY